MKIIITSYYIAYVDSNNRFHREDGPALEYNFGDKEWRKNGKFHRMDGPAIIRVCDVSDLTGRYAFEWWVEGERTAYATKSGIITCK